MKHKMNYSELNFFKNIDSIHGIMTFEEFIELMTQLKGNDYEKGKLFNLLKALGNLQDYVIESSVQVLVIYPSGAQYIFQPPYFKQMPDLLGLTDAYENVSLDLNTLLSMAREYYRENMSNKTSVIGLLDVDDVIKENLKVDQEPATVSEEQIKTMKHMVSGDRLKRVQQMLSNQYNLENDEY